MNGGGSLWSPLRPFILSREKQKNLEKAQPNLNIIRKSMQKNVFKGVVRVFGRPTYHNSCNIHINGIIYNIYTIYTLLLQKKL